VVLDVSFFNQENRVFKGFIFALGFVALLYLVSIGLAVIYLPRSLALSSEVQQTIFGFLWYWTFEIAKQLWYWGMVVVIIILGGFIDVLLKMVFEPAWRILVDPGYYYSGASFQETLTLLRSVIIDLIEPIQLLGEQFQVQTVQGLRDLFEGGI
jgi:hypothetical protein